VRKAVKYTVNVKPYRHIHTGIPLNHSSHHISFLFIIPGFTSRVRTCARTTAVMLLLLPHHATSRAFVAFVWRFQALHDRMKSDTIMQRFGNERLHVIFGPEGTDPLLEVAGALV
jgi:hypothetical protein